MVKRSPEVILPYAAAISTDYFVCAKPCKKYIKQAAVDVPNDVDYHTQGDELPANTPLGVVYRGKQIHGCKYHKEVESVHWADVVQNVRVSVCPHQQQHGEV